MQGELCGSPIPASPPWEMLGRINKSTLLSYWVLEVVTFLLSAGAVGLCFTLHSRQNRLWLDGGSVTTCNV